MKKLVELKNISYEYRDEDISFKALDDVSLSIEYGEFIAITGISGSGKSTLLNVIGLLGEQTSGQYFLAGIETSQLLEAQKAHERSQKIGFVFQQFNLLDRLTVIENILLPSIFLELKSLSQKKYFHSRALNILKTLSIEDKDKSYPKALSGGQKQRVAIARALLLQPDLLLADEPTGALDGQSSREVLDIFSELNRIGKTIIIITHDPEVAARAKRRIILKDGKIEADYLQDSYIASKDPLEIIKQEKFIENSSYFKLFLHNRVILPIYNHISSIKFAFTSLKAHMMRSFLTGLGLLIGIISIIFIAGLGILAEKAFTKLFMRPATQRIYIMLDNHQGGRHSDIYWKGLEPEKEFPAFLETFAPYGKISPFYNSDDCKITSSSMSNKTRFQGMYNLEEFLDIDTTMQLGRYPTSLEIDGGAPVAVVGSDVVDALFKKDYVGRAKPNFPLGEKLAASDCNVAKVFTIIGVLNKQDMLFMRSDSNDLIYTSTQSLLDGTSRVFRKGFSIKPNPGVKHQWLADSVANYLGLKADGRITFNAFVPQEVLNKIRAMLDIINYLTGFIGFLCIFVGGIGIMNIMLVSVTERIREIGLQKSLGAKPFHVRSQVLTECITLCVLAGIIGIVIGLIIVNLISFGAAKMFPQLGSFEPIFALNGIIISIIVSFASGVCFGYFPAFKAMKVNPVECLRDE